MKLRIESSGTPLNQHLGRLYIIRIYVRTTMFKFSSSVKQVLKSAFIFSDLFCLAVKAGLSLIMQTFLKKA